MAPIKSLCVIDDDMIYQFAVKLNVDQLKLANTVLTFSDGEKAMVYFEKNKDNPEHLPEVILLDVNMPGMDGWDFLDWFKENKGKLARKISIFMVCSSIDWRDIEKGKGFEEVADYISKPLTDGSFYEILEILNKA